MIEPDEGVAAIGSGGPFAMAAATALLRNTKLSARRIAEAGHGHRRQDLHLHQRQRHLRGAGVAMVIYLPGQSVDEEPMLDELTPREIVRELDKHVVGQAEAKRAVAIALRNRIRRQKLAPEMAEEVMPKNILMIGPTGVGKTEMARRLARLANSPFLKVEASKFTEVGYVGRDVESMIRDLVDISIDMVREERLDEVADRAELNAEDRLLDLLMPPQPEPSESVERTREKLRERLREGKLDERLVEIEVKDRGADLRNHHQRGHRGNGHQPQGHAAQPLRPEDAPPQDARGRGAGLPGAGRRAEAHRHGPGDPRGAGARGIERHHLPRRNRQDRRAANPGHGPDVSREGVQRDILPIVEGTTVNTRYGFVRTDHILFIAAGAFHVSKPSDLIPELQGRFPIRVELKSLTRGGFHPHPEGAQERAGQAVHGAAGDRGHQADAHRRRAGGGGAVRRPGERELGKHRRAPPAHHHGEDAGRSLLRRPGPEEEDREGGRRLRAQAARGHRQGPGPEPLHSVGDLSSRRAFSATGGALVYSKGA